MSKHDPALTLLQIIEFADEIAELLTGRTREDLDANAEFHRALERCVELIGEAATRLPAEFREKYNAVPWRQIIGMRNAMIHGYDTVDADVLWDAASRDVPGLRAMIAVISPGQEDSGG